KPVSFTECQRANRIRTGRPIFWVHGAFGDASVFVPLAAKIQRPFYGIQARGLFDDKMPLSGVKTIAEFYRGMIQAIQPEGPYDLGGYSIGGTFAYEIARHLQAEGCVVRSLTLVDPLYPSAHRHLALGSRYDAYYSLAVGLIDLTFRKDAVDLTAMVSGLRRPDRHETDEAALVESFVAFCLEAGVRKPKRWMHDYLTKMYEIQASYNILQYAPVALTDPVERVRYFRNKRGLFFGTAAAHYNTGHRDPLDGVD